MAVVWEGVFRSQSYGPLAMLGVVRGDISVALEDPVRETTDTVVRLTYKGAYRHGQTAEFAVRYDAASGTLIGHGGGSPQVLTVSPDSVSEEDISGTYSSQSPHDSGTFALVRSA